MTWKITKVDEFPPEDVVKTVNHHRLMPAINEEAAAACMALNESELYLIRNGSDVDIAKIFVRVAPGGGMASIDLIPTPRYFRHEDDYREDFRACMLPLLREIFEASGARRITAFVPYTRGRTKKALRSVGFVHEGRIRDAVHFRRKDEPEDLFAMGLTARDFEKESGDA